MQTKLLFEQNDHIIDLGDIEKALFEKGYGAVCGVDEVGRGPLAGPVVSAAVVMPRLLEIPGLDDSKKLTPQKRETIFEQIVQLELPCSVGIIDNDDIDKMNIHKASLMSMRKAVMDLNQTPDFVLVDGNFPIPNIGQPQFAIVRGDSQCRCIAAASIVAKVTRDRIMERYETLYPSFSFSRHKGYPTAQHLEELSVHGPSDIHRRSFKPVAELLDQYALL